MSIVAIVGDCTTTTAVALASTWPLSDDVIIVEADRSGGSLVGWLDTPPTPSLSTIVANTHTFDTSPGAAWFAVDAMVRRSASGIRFIAAPVRSREASRAIGEAGTALFPLLATLDQPTVLADCGRHTPADRLPTMVSCASAIVVVHHQADVSAAAATVRLDRLAELVEAVASLGVPLFVAIVGDRPFDLDEIERFISADGSHQLTAYSLADDTLSAAVFAGRTGVSAKRLDRLPLMRSTRPLTQAVRRALGSADRPVSTDGAWLDQFGAAT